MGQLRPRDQSRVRADSLRMAAKKLSAGCASCAEGYVDLARRNGASEGEIALARTGNTPPSTVTDSSATTVSRRSFLKGITAAGAGLGMLSVSPVAALAQNSVAVRQKTLISPFGIDSNTVPGTSHLPINFYIGELGYGQCENNGPCLNGTVRGSCETRVTRGTACFDFSAARVATPPYTYGYWGLQGPGKNPGLASAHAWGLAQGEAAVGAWMEGTYANHVFGQTIFADIEAGFRGWADPQSVPDAQILNQQVLNGFLEAIASQTQFRGTLKPGVYIHARDINGPNHHYFGPIYSPSQPFALWITGPIGGTSVCGPAVGGCAPCDPNCNSAEAIRQNWDRSVRHACFGGQGAALWQFWISPCGCAGDFNFSPQTAFQFFNPVPCS